MLATTYDEFEPHTGKKAIIMTSQGETILHKLKMFLFNLFFFNFFFCFIFGITHTRSHNRDVKKKNETIIVFNSKMIFRFIILDHGTNDIYCIFLCFCLCHIVSRSLFRPVNFAMSSDLRTQCDNLNALFFLSNFHCSS